MTNNDIKYFYHCRKLGLLNEPMLEVGSARVQEHMPNLCQLAKDSGLLQTVGVDVQPGPGVDVICDFAQTSEAFVSSWGDRTFPTVAIFNVLEHTFDPINVLRNALHCVSDSGFLLAVVPVVWPLHDYPKDYVRLMPHWFETFAQQFELAIVPEAFCWLSPFGMMLTRDVQRAEQHRLPTFLDVGRTQAPLRYWRSRIVHRLFNTFGRSHWFSHAALGVAFARRNHLTA